MPRPDPEAEQWLSFAYALTLTAAVACGVVAIGLAALASLWLRRIRRS